MCRVLAYLGTPVLLDNLLYQSDSSLVKQAYNPQMLHMLNLAGFGMAAWEPNSYEPEVPFIYKTTSIPVFDRNLKGLALKLRPTCVLAHIRGVAYDPKVHIGLQNIHPFKYEGFRLTMAHNGDLAGFADMKFDLLPYIKPQIAQQIQGTTDSEWVYALLMSQVEDPTQDLELSEILPALESTLKILRQVRKKVGISTSSSLNLFICDGNDLVSTRFTFDFGCYGKKVHEANLSYLSLWYTMGHDYGWHDGEWKMTGGYANADSVILASEPLTKNIASWNEVPEYSMIYVSSEGGHYKVKTVELDV